MTENFVLTCCSTADMPAEYFERRRIPFVCFHFMLGGVQYPDDLGKTVPFEDFYRRISEGATPTTSQVNTAEYLDFFEPFLAAGHDIVHISLSSGISGSYSGAIIAREELCARYPERKLVIIDSLGASSGYGMLVDDAADMRDAGLTAEQAGRQIEELKLHIHHWFFSTDLSSYRRGGRISSAEAIVGTVLGICPLLNMDAKGHLTPRKKVRGKRKVTEKIVQMMEEHADGGTAYDGKCFISNSACFEDAARVRELIEARFPKLSGRVLINSVGTTIGSHTGPGTVALFFKGDLRG